MRACVCQDAELYEEPPQESTDNGNNVYEAAPVSAPAEQTYDEPAQDDMYQNVEQDYKAGGGGGGGGGGGKDSGPSGLMVDRVQCTLCSHICFPLSRCPDL